jgi:SAM-dependent methyltransferase
VSVIGATLDMDDRCHRGQSVFVPDRGDHWARVYASRPTNELSWYEHEPATSLRMIDAIATGAAAAIIDIGAGASSLVDHLLARGFTDLTLLDVSAPALHEVAARLGDRAEQVRFVVHDVLTWEPNRQFDLWHDRAVFHFLVDAADQDRYVQLAATAVGSGGHVVLATFAEDGPTQCSGAAVSRYSAEQLGTTFSASFALVEQAREQHVTPRGIVQPFTWVVLRHR